MEVALVWADVKGRCLLILEWTQTFEGIYPARFELDILAHHLFDGSPLPNRSDVPFGDPTLSHRNMLAQRAKSAVALLS